MLFLVRDIEWDTGGEMASLPTEVWVECESQENIADALSDTYGWLVNDFEVAESRDK